MMDISNIRWIVLIVVIFGNEIDPATDIPVIDNEIVKWDDVKCNIQLFGISNFRALRFSRRIFDPNNPQKHKIENPFKPKSLKTTGSCDWLLCTSPKRCTRRIPGNVTRTTLKINQRITHIRSLPPKVKSATSKEKEEVARFQAQIQPPNQAKPQHHNQILPASSTSSTLLNKKYNDTTKSNEQQAGQQAQSNFSRMNNNVDINKRINDRQIMGNYDDQLAVDHNDVSNAADGQTVADDDDNLVVIPQRNLVAVDKNDDAEQTTKIPNEEATTIEINGPKNDESMTKDVSNVGPINRKTLVDSSQKKLSFETRPTNNGNAIYDPAKNYDEEIVINVDKNENDLDSSNDFLNSFFVKSKDSDKNNFTDKKLSEAMAAKSQMTFEEDLTSENSIITTVAENQDGQVELKKIDDITNTEATEEEVVFPHQEVEALKDEDVKDDEDSNEIFDNDTSITTTSTLKSINLADQELVHPVQDSSTTTTTTTEVMDPQETMFDPIGTGKMSEEKREPQTSSTPRARTTKPATSITTTTTFRSTTKEVFQGWRGYKLQSSTLRNNNKRRKDFFEENSSRKLHPDDATTTTKIQRTRSSTSPTSSPTPTSLPSPPPTRSSSSRNQKEVVRAEADAEENNMMSSTTELLTTIVTERKGSPVITTTTSRRGNKDVEFSDKKEAPRRLFKRPQQEFEESSWKIDMLLLGITVIILTIMAFVSALNYVKMTFDYIFCTDGKSQKKTASAIAASEQPLLLLAQKDKEDVRLKMGNDCVKFMALGQREEEEEGSFSSAHTPYAASEDEAESITTALCTGGISENEDEKDKSSSCT